MLLKPKSKKMKLKKALYHQVMARKRRLKLMKSYETKLLVTSLRIIQP